MPYILSDELILKGQKDLKTQIMIMILWTLVSVGIQLGGQIHDEKNSYCTVCNEWKKFTGWT